MPNPKVSETAHVTITRRVHATFDGPEAACDLTLRELRAAIDRAVYMPDEALVTVRVGGDWVTPSMLMIECDVQRPAEADDIVYSDEAVRNR